ncbi:cyclodeaminase/cyclohydrolase family protein [Desulfoluna spongiiphila]|uniref:Formiminotetrahydrofolate cyclodeaminase n=1 Tax=Desulfoluna spongiiphila TaxID=419481 RepID=A0A1G5D905_9BACT|nr:cyclodeaminase/cyclohydrolase family protein [Desulfoluna spongiiphila]SCY11027.1 Formiminotetrahydrofolate cyclodeaminase [Desulfoluna spongiiphila]VVS95274.1 cyclodeaminase/cyclohydrolase [Desulfoluna spongiiphila]
MSMAELSSKEFLSQLASKAPIPGGGGAAALGGAVGMALSNMVGNLTTGKKKYQDVEEEVLELLKKGDVVIRELLALIDADAEVFKPLAKAYSLPKGTPEEAQTKAETIEACCKTACSVPMQIMRKACEGIAIHKRMGEIGTVMAVSDVGCGVVFLKAALISAQLNVIINLNSIKDEDYLAATRNEMDILMEQGTVEADDTLEIVMEKLTK